MNTNQIVFKLNTNESIVFELFDDISKLYPCDEVVVKFYNKNNKYLLGIDCVRERTESLYNLINDALDNKAKLHKSILNDIGYLWNEEMQDKPGLSYFKIAKIKYWVGLKNLIWSTPSNANPILSTWLYNDESGEIVLEITPSYPWHFIDAEDIKDENFISYEEWIKNYKPLLRSIISKKVAIIWKKQAQEILDILKKNIAEYEK